MNKLDNSSLYNQDWERLLKKNAYRGYKINRMADAVLDKNAADLTLKSNGNKIQISFEEHTIHLDRLARSSHFSFARLKHRIRLPFGNYKQRHNEKIKHLADLITEKIKLDKDQLGIPLIDAIEKEDFARAKELIDSGVNLNCVNKEGRTPLILAAWKKQPELVKLLIDSGAQVNEVDINGSTPLMFAAEAGDVIMVELLLNAGSDTQAKTNKGSTALHFAVKQSDNLEVINKLIEAGCDANAIREDGYSVFHLAVIKGNLEVVNSLVDGGCDIGGKIPDGRTPLMLAAEKQPELVKLLIESGAKVNEVDNYGFTPLHFAVMNNVNLNVINKLIEAGCDCHAKTSDEYTALHYAADAGNLEMIDQLIDLGCAIDEKTQQKGLTPFHLAAKKGHLEAVNRLIDAGCDIESKSSKGSSALYIAAKAGEFEVFKRLIDVGCDVDAITNGGLSVLDIIKAVRPFNYDDFVRLIKIENPDLKLRNKEQKYRKQLAHVWHMEGVTSLNAEIELQLTGGSYRVWMHQIRKNLPVFNDLYPNAFANPDLFEEAILFSSKLRSNDAILARIQTKQPTFITAGFDGHEVTLLVWKNQFVICNRGAASRKPMEIYHFDENAFNLKILESILIAKDRSSGKYKKLFFDAKDPSSLPLRLKLTKSSLDKKLEKKIALDKQTVGNCSWVSPITGIFAFFLLDSIEEDGLEEGFQKASHCFETWHHFEQIASLEQMMKLLPEGKSPYDFDHDLFQKALNKAQQLDLDPLLADKLMALTDAYAQMNST